MSENLVQNAWDWYKNAWGMLNTEYISFDVFFWSLTRVYGTLSYWIQGYRITTCWIIVMRCNLSLQQPIYVARNPHPGLRSVHFCSTGLCTFSSEPDSYLNAWEKCVRVESPALDIFCIVHVCRDNWINCTHAKYLRNNLISTLVVVFLLTVLYFQLGHIWYKVRVGTIGIIT